jgi:RNA polymerase sigma-70 factor (ECF subfamily)
VKSWPTAFRQRCWTVLDALVATLAADVVVVGDSGGASPSCPRRILGGDKVSRLLLSLAEQASQLGIAVQRAEVNGRPGAVFRAPAGQLINVFSVEIAAGAVQTVRSVINQEKLGHLGPLADLGELQQQRRAQRG